MDRKLVFRVAHRRLKIIDSLALDYLSVRVHNVGDGAFGGLDEPLVPGKFFQDVKVRKVWENERFSLSLAVYEGRKVSVVNSGAPLGKGDGAAALNGGGVLYGVPFSKGHNFKPQQPQGKDKSAKKAYYSGSNAPSPRFIIVVIRSFPAGK